MGKCYLRCFFIKRNRITQHHADSLINLLPEGEINYKRVETSVELRLVWNIDQNAYKDLNIGSERLKDWRNKNNNSLFIRKKGGTIEGSFGLWPITKDAFNDIIEFKKTDVQIGTSDLDEFWC